MHDIIFCIFFFLICWSIGLVRWIELNESSMILDQNKVLII